LRRVYPELGLFENPKVDWSLLSSYSEESKMSDKAKPYPPYHIRGCKVDDYTYISKNCWMVNTEIGKFCSIGPNFISGWGVHPVDGLSTAPMFYSTKKQNGMSLSLTDKVEENKPVYIHNDVFIGMNSTVLCGITIGDGAVVGACSVVTKDVPPYAIVAGNPAKIIRFRFSDEIICELLKIKWWNWPADKLGIVEKHFFDIKEFIKAVESQGFK
jgi:virginiamycin A acetyltransferase